MDKVIIMDEKGYIFTADATLALVVVIVFTVTVVSYTMLPIYIGQDHQHLEALADSALQTMEEDGTLRYASIIAMNNSTNATYESAVFLNESLQTLIPSGIGYKITINPGTSISADNKGVPGTPTYSTDVVTRVRVISGAQEGWWGRAWYKSEPVEFTTQQINLTTTSWVFHNWLTNYPTWSGTGLKTNLYWGGGSNPSSITFAIPANATILSAKFLQGSASTRTSGSVNQSFGTNTVINGNPAIVTNQNQFTFLNQRVDSSQNMYNYQGNIPVSSLNTGNNNFYVQFLTNSNFNYDMPWFSILSTYTTGITVPMNVTTDRLFFPNAAGLAVNRNVSLGNGTWGYGRTYDLSTGQLTTLTTLREIDWDDMIGHDHYYSDGVPFVIDDIPNKSGNAMGSAVCVEKSFTVPSTSNILDGYVVVNSWGAADSTLVEVWSSDTSTWRTVFNSFGSSYTARGDGYGNLPGIIYIGDELRQGATNKVRITTWDDVPSSDFDLVGLQDSFVVLSTSDYKVKWDTYPFNSHQASGNTETQTQIFTLTTDSQKAMLFLGVGLNTRTVEVRYGGTNQILYSGPVTFSLDLASLDAQKGFHRITTSNSTATNYTLVPGSYPLQVKVTGPRYAWESGDDNYGIGDYGVASIFSGTRVVVINPQIQNEWSSGMGSNPQIAILNATSNLNDTYKRLHNGNPIPSTLKIYTSAIYTGNTPNAVTVRLDLWKQ